MHQIHRFGDALPLDDRLARRWLGSKGASLAEMTQLGLPVPAGFTLSTQVWESWTEAAALPSWLPEQIRAEVAVLEKKTGRRFGSPERPLLLSVRSGGPVSMPGMLDTVLNVGINTDIARGLAKDLGDEAFAADVRSRFVESFATAALGVPLAAFDALVGPRRRGMDGLDDRERAALLHEQYALVERECSQPISDDPWEQLFSSIEGVLRSWQAPRAQKYRAARGISSDDGTGVTLQQMVYGNLNDASGSGVAFSRNPSTGAPYLFGEWLRRSQGEDIVSGRHTPSPLSLRQVRRGRPDSSMESAFPEVTEELAVLSRRLEQRYGDMQDIEFTVQDGQLFVLQCRSAKRSAKAAARIAVDLVNEGVIGRKQALRRVDPASLRQLLTPHIPDPQRLAEQGIHAVGVGLAAGPGGASGRLVFDQEGAEAFGREDVILVRADTSAEDVDIMRRAAGVLTSCGGLTSHAAVVARAMGKPCVAGAEAVHVDYGQRRIVIRQEDGRSEVIEHGELLTIDGSRGLIYRDAVPVEPAPTSPDVEELLRWADERRNISVLAQVDSPLSAKVGFRFGADGVVLLRPNVSDLSTILLEAGSRPVWIRVGTRAALEGLWEQLRPGDGVWLSNHTQAEGQPGWPSEEEFSTRGLLRLVDGTAGAALSATTSITLIDVADDAAIGSLADRGLEEGASVALRGSASASLSLIPLLHQLDRGWVLTEPTDVPVGRLWAARISAGTGQA